MLTQSITEDPKTHEHWVGWKNKLIRYWFYINTGLGIFNQFKYLIAAIIGLYWTLHLKNHWYLIWMTIGSIPALGIIGYYSIHHCNKVMDWLGFKFGSYYTLHQIKVLEEIRDSLKGKNG